MRARYHFAMVCHKRTKLLLVNVSLLIDYAFNLIQNSANYHSRAKPYLLPIFAAKIFLKHV